MDADKREFFHILCILTEDSAIPDANKSRFRYDLPHSRYFASIRGSDIPRLITL
jgi:hypothetical protein